jgi:hypothetical protein
MKSILMRHLVFCLVVTVFISSGCIPKNTIHDDDKQIKNSDIPPPYKLAIEAIENYNFQNAIEMLDLTIQDFPDNDFAYHANILKYSILSSQWKTYMLIVYAHIEKAPSSAFIEESEKCSMIANKYLSLAENTMAQQELIMDYLQKNYTGKIIVLDVGNFKPKNNTEFFSMLDWVRSVGFPESEEAVERKRKDSLSDAFYATLFSYFGEDAIDTIKPLTGTIDYPALFLDLGLSTADESLSVKFLQKVIELTDGDKYNKHRLSAEKLLKEKNGNQ